jgi:hypothetical protein
MFLSFCLQMFFIVVILDMITCCFSIDLTRVGDVHVFKVLLPWRPDRCPNPTGEVVWRCGGFVLRWMLGHRFPGECFDVAVFDSVDVPIQLGEVV